MQLSNEIRQHDIIRVAVEVGSFIPACKLYFSCISFVFLSALRWTILFPTVAVVALTHRGCVEATGYTETQ